MPAYVITSDSPITAREVNKPDLPDWEVGGGPVEPPPGFWGPGGRPGQGLPPHLPPRDEWPPLPPFLQPGPGLPIPPTPEFPMVPIDPEVDPPAIWPPIPAPPSLPDLSGKTLILARFYVSRQVNFLRWVVIDHEEAKTKLQKALDWLKAHMPAGGIIGRPPQAGNRPGS